jgi:hypothetical protein
MVVINPQRTRARHYCQPCDHYVCDEYACVTYCTPLKKQIDDILEAATRSLALQEI